MLLAVSIANSFEGFILELKYSYFITKFLYWFYKFINVIANEFHYLYTHYKVWQNKLEELLFAVISKLIMTPTTYTYDRNHFEFVFIKI